MDASEEFIIVCVTAPLLLHKLQNLLNYESKAPVREAINQLQLISTWQRDTEKIPTNLDVKAGFWRGFLKELHRLEDCIDYFIGEIELRRRNDSLKIMSHRICLRPQQDRIVLIREKLNSFITSTSAKKVFTELEKRGPTTGTTSSPQPRNLDYPVPDDSDFVGLKDKIDQLVELLCDRETSSIAVTGEADSGKTFLTKTVYNATEVKRHFHGRAWVNYLENFEYRDFLLNILTQLTWDWEWMDENLSDDELKLKLQNFSSEKRCLIVVDFVRTIQNFSERLWDVCRLSSKGICSVFIVSIQEEEIGYFDKQNICFSHIIRLQSLTDEESWTLFCKKAQKAEEEVINLKENILRNCGGSPRAILIMEGLLSTTKRPSVIEHKIHENVLNLSYQPSVIEHKIHENILNLSYQDLSSQMKVCFLYFGLFPRAFEIPVRRLFHLWVAEGLLITLPPDEENMALKDLAEECLKLLIRRNLIEVTKVRLDGSPKTCRMPTTIWDVFSRKAAALGHYLVMDKSDFEHDIRRLTDNVPNGIGHGYIEHVKHLRSYVSFGRILKSTDQFLHDHVYSGGLGLLVVLDLENAYKPMLSETLGKLLHLKHLGLRRTFLDSLPSSVGNLPYLETLDVKHTNMTTLPSSIWKAKNLQHLYLNENNFGLSFKPYIRSEIILQTLSGLFIGNKSVVKIYSYTLLRLRKLRLTFYSKLVEGIADWISKLKTLRSLRLRSIDEVNVPSTLKLGSLETHDKLLELYLVGRLAGTIRSLFPPNLKILTLSASKLRDDPMPILGKLRHLNCLSLFRNSYVGDRMMCDDREFPQLRVLKLWMLEDLEEWTVKEGSMPHLRELEIRLCHKLKQPEGLPNTLKDVFLINMPDQFLEYVERFGAFVKRIEFPFLPVRLTECPVRCIFNEIKLDLELVQN